MFEERDHLVNICEDLPSRTLPSEIVGYQSLLHCFVLFSAARIYFEWLLFLLYSAVFIVSIDDNFSFSHQININKKKKKQITIIDTYLLYALILVAHHHLNLPKGSIERHWQCFYMWLAYRNYHIRKRTYLPQKSDYLNRTQLRWTHSL